MKRLIDLTLAVPLFILSSPIIVITFFLIRFKLGSPVLFRQKRPGLHGEPFYLYKFRTMTDKRDSMGNLLPDSIRLTTTGKFLRKYSIDELPQLLNVIKGNLSLVGPRPLLMEYLPLYNQEQSQRHNVRPGITGWAQVNGRNAISWEEKFKLDVWYVNNHTVLLDLKILWLTVLKVIKTEGINQSGNVTMETFKGTESTLGEGHR
ncbi:sugar transferase [Mesobacillus foraminis]|uniref:sugar transferase n=1 Tax=Mesobacillus foraminis TaxID=279826 RepID=UPI0039A1478A